MRHSLTHPHDYVDSNVTGTLNILEACRHRGTEHLVYASSSSVYGANTDMPFSVHDNVDHPLSMYAATKKATELMAHTYSHLFGVPTTGLRFFTVYGPRGRPDMALFLFTEAILAGRPIDVFNEGRMQRDFTYIDDIVEGVVRVLDRPAQPDAGVEGQRSRSRVQHRAVPPLQHREQQSRRAAAVHRRDRGRDRPQGRAQPACRCNPATSRPRTPTSTTSRATSASRPTPRSRSAWRASSSGIASYYGIPQ